MKKPYFELQLAVIFLDPPARITASPEALLLLDGGLVVFPVDTLEPGSQARRAIEDNLFAEVNVPYQTDSEAFTFICHVFGKANHEPAILEMLRLQDVTADILARYRPRCRPAGEVETDQDRWRDDTLYGSCPECGFALAQGDDGELYCPDCAWSDADLDPGSQQEQEFNPSPSMEAAA